VSVFPPMTLDDLELLRRMRTVSSGALEILLADALEANAARGMPEGSSSRFAGRLLLARRDARGTGPTRRAVAAARFRALAREVAGLPDIADAEREDLRLELLRRSIAAPGWSRLSPVGPRRWRPSWPF